MPASEGPCAGPARYISAAALFQSPLSSQTAHGGRGVSAARAPGTSPPQTGHRHSASRQPPVVGAVPRRVGRTNGAAPGEGPPDVGHHTPPPPSGLRVPEQSRRVRRARGDGDGPPKAEGPALTDGPRRRMARDRGHMGGGGDQNTSVVLQHKMTHGTAVDRSATGVGGVQAPTVPTKHLLCCGMPQAVGGG